VSGTGLAAVGNREVETLNLHIGRKKTPRSWGPTELPCDEWRLLSEEGQVRAWVREGLIEWLGPRDDMPELLRSAHVAVLPSYHEGAPCTGGSRREEWSKG
jgi:glycosyltransferase involved in cell wall biosynthesis